MTGEQIPIAIVTGPTASGKSRVALDLAPLLGAEVVNLDSVQIYRGLDVGSAKLRVEEREGILHHLIDCCDPEEHFDVARYLEAAAAAVAACRSRGKLPLFVGGSTMYLTALLHGLVDLPKANKELRRELDTLSNEALYSELRNVDPQRAAELHPADRRRVIRAVESYRLSGIAASVARQQHSYGSQQYRAAIAVLCWPRTILYQRINKRSETMVGAGLLEETRGVLEEIVPRPLPLVLNSIGYAEACQALAGTLAIDQLPQQIAQATRRYAKRQMTYFRNEPAKRGWRASPQQPEVEPDPKNVSADFSCHSWTISELGAAIRRNLQDTSSTEHRLFYVQGTTLLQGR